MDLLIQGVSTPCLTDSTVVGAQCQSWVSRRLCSAGGAAALCSTHHHAVLPPAFLQLDGSSSTMPRRSISIPYPSIRSPSQRGSIHSLYAFCPPHTKSLFWLLYSLFTKYMSFSCLALSFSFKAYSKKPSFVHSAHAALSSLSRPKRLLSAQHRGASSSLSCFISLVFLSFLFLLHCPECLTFFLG